jgi:sigma-B regulation protein RsbU (phosphoserine phosphatase)
MAFLTAISGSSYGRRFDLDKPETIMGRHPDCDVTIDVGAVSRHHARIRKQAEDRFDLEDLSSRNGTFLNGELIQGSKSLTDGDVIQICDIEYSFHSDSASGLESHLLGASDHALQGDGSSFGVLLVDDEEDKSRNSREFSSKLDIRGSQHGSQLTSSAEVRLEAMLEISQNLGGALKVEDVLPKVLDSLFKIFLQADRAFVVLQEDGELIPRWFKTRKPEEEETFRISRTVMREVMETRQSIISLDASSDERFEMSHSISDFKIRSIIVSPLINVAGEPLGAIQMDTLDSKRRFEQGDLEILASIATQAAIAIENAQLHEQLLEQNKLEQDLELASNVQQALLPSRRPVIDSFEFFDYYHPADQIGGDYFDYIELADGRFVVIVADVSGHGIAAAMFMAKLSAETKFLLASESSPSEAITKLNRQLCTLGVEKFVTLLCLVIQPESGQTEIVNAGHMAPIWKHADGTIEEPGYEAAGVPIGVVDDWTYESATIELGDGESLFMYTDGINEAPDPDGEMFGINRLREKVRGEWDSIEALGCEVIEEVRQHSPVTPQADDMCLVLLHRRRGSAETS